MEFNFSNLYSNLGKNIIAIAGAIVGFIVGGPLLAIPGILIGYSIGHFLNNSVICSFE